MATKRNPIPSPSRMSRLRARLTDGLGGNWRQAIPAARWRLHLPGRGGLIVLPYMGYATADTVALRGRVLRERPQAAEAQPDDGAWRNFRALMRLMNSAEVPGAEVDALVDGRRHPAVCDSEGYFRLEAPRPDPVPAFVDLELTRPRPADGAPVVTAAPLLLPPDTARFGIVSDIDDTVVRTDVLNRRRMVLTLARTNAHTRLPFAGVAELYRAFVAGPSGADGNPIFYVSSSPWNLYTPLAAFLRLNGIPEGPMFLKDWGPQTLFHRDHGVHKHAAIREVLMAYPQLPFVLLGDSGEQDPEIYAEVVHEFPTRIAAVYIRNVHPDPRRHAAIEHLIDEASAAGVPYLLAPDSGAMAVHAAGRGLVRLAPGELLQDDLQN